MGGPGREVDEERLVGRERFLELHPRDRVVGHVGHEVVARVVRRLDPAQAFVETRVPLVSLAADESIELVEARARGPAIGGARRADLPRRRLVVLAEHGCAVPVQPQHLGQRRDVVGPRPRVTREGGGDLRDAPHVVHVVVAPGEKGGPRRRAERGSVELVEAQPLAGQAVGVGHPHRPAEGARHAEAHVVHEDDEHVGRARGRLDLEARGRLGVARVEHGAVRVVRFRDGQHRPIHRRALGTDGSPVQGRHDQGQGQHEASAESHSLHGTASFIDRWADR
jgi:hypothetical protein